VAINNSSQTKHTSTEYALDLLACESRLWLTNMDETQDRGCYEPGSDEEAEILAKADASYRVADVLEQAYLHLLNKALVRGHVA